VRGKPWGIQKIHKLLSDPLYMGAHYFNVIASKTHKKRPPSEWIKVADRRGNFFSYSFSK
jgi:hypothetical protein